MHSLQYSAIQSPANAVHSGNMVAPLTCFLHHPLSAGPPSGWARQSRPPPAPLRPALLEAERGISAGLLSRGRAHHERAAGGHAARVAAARAEAEALVAAARADADEVVRRAEERLCRESERRARELRAAEERQRQASLQAADLVRRAREARDAARLDLDEKVSRARQLHAQASASAAAAVAEAEASASARVAEAEGRRAAAEARLARLQEDTAAREARRAADVERRVEALEQEAQERVRAVERAAAHTIELHLQRLSACTLRAEEEWQQTQERVKVELEKVAAEEREVRGGSGCRRAVAAP
ncbi:unnamed protein product [Prorocentrum cordatum]|uniref:Meiosis-specific nuclear structural protein 1 n=1 Tax=Prorocentrum cordatum TaxID=2364126 RepID=A0ABN9SQ64_9DINO|nr:unnamed protein product [Polarella glacialis]